MKILLTGFDAFGKEESNPSSEILDLVPDEIEGCEIIKAKLPTVFYKSIDLLDELINDNKPDAVISIGQAGNRTCINSEVVAINKNDASIADNEGNKPEDEPIIKDGENAYFSSLPNKAIIKALHEVEIPARLSYTAGTFVCNQVFYYASYLASKKYPDMRCGFIHVPYSAKQVLDKYSAPYMSLSDMAKALHIIIRTTILGI